MNPFKKKTEKKPEIKIGDYVVAEWIDSATDTTDWKKFNGKFWEYKITTVGILIHQDKDKIVVVHMQDNKNQYKYSTLITTGMLRSLRKLC